MILVIFYAREQSNHKDVDMKKTKKAVLILEQPWWDLNENPNRTSVYPFFHGMEKLMDDVKVYHTTFY